MSSTFGLLSCLFCNSNEFAGFWLGKGTGTETGDLAGTNAGAVLGNLSFLGQISTSIFLKSLLLSKIFYLT